MAPSATQTSVPTVTNTATETSQPTVTASPTETTTLTPLPNLPADEAMDLVVELLNTNAGCQLPCYWGFTPGITLWDETGQFLEAIAYKYSTQTRAKDTVSGAVTLSVPEEIDPSLYLMQAYTVQDGIIDRIRVQTGIVPTYTLSTFMNTYGPPDEIWVAPGREEPEAFIVRLFYPGEGILAAYYRFTTMVTNTDVVICPRNESNPSLTLWSPVKNKSFFDVHNEVLGHIDSELFLFHKIEEVTDMNVETFYDTYSDPDTEICFHIPREKWPDLRVSP
jgi:hypothetical protein